MNNGNKWFLPFSFFVTAGIVNQPEAVIGNAVRGSGSHVIQAFTSNEAAGGGKSVWIVANNISSFDVQYR
ncbi:hypothetical protein BPS13_0266 [Bacillus phage BPS13]|nr:hypothetical protein BPS13_0266 [Bacillus phage BPS13]AEZ50445.1 hypothetical protein BPS13_0266 [Bacillus phage BPS13]